MANQIKPYIPDYITVHLGPPDSEAENVTVTFPYYIKNVASSEIYPTWNESAIYANIYSQISYALNRVYTEYYRSRGYNFNITSSTAYDQKFENGRNIFENIDRIVNDIFTSYIRRQGNIEPLAAKYCNGTTTTCDGLSQWGSEELASSGYNSVEILKYYYGDNVELVVNAPIAGQVSFFTGKSVRLGDSGETVLAVQDRLNAVSRDYPSIPKIADVNGIFDENTENTVITFQRIFNLTADGIVGNATWNKLMYIYVAIRKLSELESEGIRLEETNLEFSTEIRIGDTGLKVSNIQYFLSVIAQFDDRVPSPEIDGEFSKYTLDSVNAYQNAYGLTVTDYVDEVTWNSIYDTYIAIANVVLVSTAYKNEKIHPMQYPGETLSVGDNDFD